MLDTRYCEFITMYLIIVFIWICEVEMTFTALMMSYNYIVNNQLF